jgi:hypothetical protein
MSARILDGGPAFPVDHQFVNPKATQEELKTACGITVRDWFAGQALIGQLAQAPRSPSGGIAEQCYEYADAMLVARQSK